MPDKTRLLVLQSRVGDAPVQVQVVCTQNGTAVLEGLRHDLVHMFNVFGQTKLGEATIQGIFLSCLLKSQTSGRQGVVNFSGVKHPCFHIAPPARVQVRCRAVLLELDFYPSAGG